MIRDTLFLAVELIALFFGVAFAVQLFQRRVGSDRLQAWLGGSPVVAALKGIAIGFVTPFCTFSAVPMLIGFRQAKVRTAGYVAFIVAAPVLDPVLFGALVLIAGLPAAIIYLLVAFVAAIALALFADSVGIDKHLKPLPVTFTEKVNQGSSVAVGAVAVAATQPRFETPVAESSPSSCHADVPEAPWAGLRIEASAAARSAAELLRSVAVVLAAGIAVGILIEANVTPEMTARLTGDNSVLSIPVAAALGTPLYFSTALFVPIADALTTAGVGLGAIVALTISGSGASVPEFLLLTKLATKKILSVFFAYVLVIAILGGFLTEVIVS